MTNKCTPISSLPNLQAAAMRYVLIQQMALANDRHVRHSMPFVHVRYSIDIRILLWKADTVEIATNTSGTTREICRILIKTEYLA